MKTYVLTISQTFPKTHPDAGNQTYFVGNIKQEIKKHTIRSNYELWEKRFKNIQEGKAVLSVRVWTGKPYNSPQKEVFRFTNADGIGIEKIQFKRIPNDFFIGDRRIDSFLLAENDGLTPYQFKDWFQNYDLTKPMAVIHFTGFRYGEIFAN